MTQLTICVLSVNLVFSSLGFLSDNFFLIAQFLEHCLLLHFYTLLVHKVGYGHIVIGWPTRQTKLL